MESSRFAEESGPDEDQLLRKPQLLKVIGVDCPMVIRNSGVINVKRTDPVIENFLSDVPSLIMQNETFGLIWDENLKPENFKYEKGVHFVSTREADKKTSYSTVSFYRDGVTGAAFAIKTLRKGTHFRPEEIKVGLTIQHQNICSVYGIIIAKGKVQILLEHAGSPLYSERAWIAKCPKRMQSFAKQSFQALEVIHGHGFVHCDIKPDNMMIYRHGYDEFTVKLIDFGTCHLQGSSLPSTAHTTPLYWAPEIWQALKNKNEFSCTPAMDVYALALTLHFVHMCNHLMKRFENEDLKNLMIKTPDDILLIALPETIPSDLSIVMKSCLSGDYKIRSSAEEALKQLTECTLLRRPSSSTGEGNYKDSLNRIFSSISKTARHAIPDTSNTVYKSSATSQSLFQNSQEIGGSTSSICIDKRELKTVAKTKKNTFLSSNKFNKSSQKFKKRTPFQFKQMVTKMPPETFQKPFLSPDTDLEKGIEPKPDDKDYCCSTLLKNLALRLKDPHQMSTSSAQNNSLENSGIVQLVMVDKPTGKTMKMSKLPSYKIRDDDPKSENLDNSKFKGKNKMGTIENDGNTEKDSQVKITGSLFSAPAGEQAVTESYSQLEDNTGKNDCGSVHDDMEFVLCAFNDDVFTGGADEIVDNMCAMLDKDEQTESSHSSKSFEMDVSNHQVRAIKQGEVAFNTEEEPMDAEQEESASVSKVNIRNTSNPAVKWNRKRVAESSMNPSCIPGKAVFFPPSLQDMKTHQLPNFDQILPENC